MREKNMQNIDRRRLLGSLAVSALCRDFANADNSQPIASVGREQSSNRQERWFVARQRRNITEHQIVDFWAKPIFNVYYADLLPPQIVRGALWPECEPREICRDAEGSGHNDLTLTQDRLDWLGDQREFFECSRAEGNLPSLEGIADKKAPLGGVRRTALLALDSKSAKATDKAWIDILPAFRRCYDRVIGHFHIEQRGFLHWKTWLQAQPFDATHFDKYFTEAALLCDAVIFTSQSLAENDAYLSARASTEALVGELMRRLGQILLDELALDEIAPLKTSGERTYPHVFALGSAGASIKSGGIVSTDLVRQRELVFSSFGKPILRPLLIATCADRRCAESIPKQIVGSNIKFLATKTSAERKIEDQSLEWFEFATLWPFDPNSGAWP